MSVGLEPLQLRMMGIAASLATKDSLGQQSLAPQGDQTLWIEILWV